MNGNSFRHRNKWVGKIIYAAFSRQKDIKAFRTKEKQGTALTICTGRKIYCGADYRI
jgi:hypothetical protein